MAHRDPAPVWFQTRASIQLILYLIAIHALGGLGLWLAELPATLRLGAGLVLLASLGHGLWIHGARRGARAVRAVHWRADGGWRVLDGRGGAGDYQDQRVVLADPALLLVRLSGPTGRRWLVLAGDSADAESLRLLRVRLRRRVGRGDRAQDGPLAGT